MPQMAALREELTPLRQRLQRAEQTIFYGKGLEVKDSLRKWDLVVSELERTYGQDPHLITVSSVLKFGHDVGEATDDLRKLRTGWASF